MIYDHILKLLMIGKMEEFKDAFSQMQHVYKQDVSGDRRLLEKKARKYETKKLEAEKNPDQDKREEEKKIVDQLEEELKGLR